MVTRKGKTALVKTVDLGTSMSVDFDDRARKIQDTAATSSFMDHPVGTYSFRNPSIVYLEHPPKFTDMNIILQVFGSGGHVALPFSLQW